MKNESNNFKLNCIHHIPLFRVLNEDEKNSVFDFVYTKKYKAGELIYRPNEKASSIYIVSSGKIRIYRLAENGKEQLLRILIPGDFTGELALFKEGIYEAYAESIEDTTLCMINHYDFKKLLTKYPLLSTKMLEVLANRLSSSEEQTAWIATETVRDRLIHYLSRIAPLNNEHEKIINLNITKKDLASYLGTTPESLSREWTKLENENIIKQLNKKKVKLIGFSFELNSCIIV
ncbi:MAG: Crp/Fnr family transcriptional regulator [Acholeplasmataceae bacterium]